MGGASINGNNRFRTPYESLLPGCFHIPSPYTYRNPFHEAIPNGWQPFAFGRWKTKLPFRVQLTIAAFIMEPVLGAGGIIVPHESFMPQIREVCDRNGIFANSRRGNYRLWPHGRLVRFAPLGCSARPHALDKSHHQRIFSVWCRDVISANGGCT